MTALIDATDSQMAMLADLVESLEIADATVNAMMAARDGLFALAGRMAVDIAKQGDHPDRGDMTIRAVAAEIGQRLRVSDRTVERKIGEASWLVDGFPAVWQAQGAGRITAAHAHVIIDAGAQLTDDDQRAEYAEAVLAVAEVESPNRLRVLAKRIAERFQEQTIDDRHRAARERRRVWATDGEDGMADLHVHAPAVLVHAMKDRVSEMAHRIRTENIREAREAAADGIPFDPDTRSVDEIRADLFADLVLSGTPVAHDSADGLLGEIRGRVEITVPVLTLMAEDAAEAASSDGDASSTTPPPALLDGVVPIDTDTARALAGSATGWDRVLTHPITGAMLAVDRYRPSEQLRRHLRARDQRCRFPTCGIVARKCDIDHNDPASTGGATAECNLCCFCRRHHTLKHASPWHVEHHPGGVLEWTSPAGRTYTDTPPVPHTVVFVAEADGAPPTGTALLARARAPF